VSSRARRNGGRQRRPSARQGGWGLWFGPVLGATIIVVLAWAASLEQATPELFVAASLVFSICEGIVLAFIGAVWSQRGVALAVVAACITAVLATPGRWEVAYLRTGVTPQTTDLFADLGVTIAWGAFAGLAGATLLRDRLLALLPRT
jgi:hypothetical protein